MCDIGLSETESDVFTGDTSNDSHSRGDKSLALEVRLALAKLSSASSAEEMKESESAFRSLTDRKAHEPTGTRTKDLSHIVRTHVSCNGATSPPAGTDETFLSTEYGLTLSHQMPHGRKTHGSKRLEPRTSRISCEHSAK